MCCADAGIDMDQEKKESKILKLKKEEGTDG
jgi:hypothetical protein